MNENYGKFSGNPKTEWLTHPNNPDRDMKLLEDFWYIDPSGRKWPAPSGSVINGASIPRQLWAIVGSPYTDDYRNASVVHDIACERNNIDRKEADKMFYYACLAGGCSIEQAQLLYLGVRIGAWISKVKKILPPRGEFLYRLPNLRLSKSEQEVQTRFDNVSSMFRGKELSFPELERLVEKELDK